MEGYAGAEDCCEDNLLVEHVADGIHAEWRGCLDFFIAADAADFVCENFAYALEVTAEAQTVGLHMYISHFGHILAYKGAVRSYVFSLRLWVVVSLRGTGFLRVSFCCRGQI